MDIHPVLERFLSALGKYKHSGKGYTAKCPAHNDTHMSLSINLTEDRILCFCQAGCDITAVVMAVGLTMQDLYLERRSSKGGTRKYEAARYDYRCADGIVRFTKIRYEPKDFRVQHSNNGDVVWKINDAWKHLIYRLPQVIEAIKAGKPVYVVEGEKDADNMARLGFTATCNYGGANKWTRANSKHLAGAKVVIIPDNDEPGKLHAADVARKLRKICPSVRILELPGLKEKEDVSVWIAAGGTAAQLEELAKDHAETAACILYPHDDSGNAARIAALYGQDIRHCHPWNRWFVWDGARWAEDREAKLSRLSLSSIDYLQETELPQAMSRAVDPEACAKSFKSWIRKSRSRGCRDAAIKLAAAEPGIPVVPELFDSDPYLLNTPAGMVDLQTGRLIAHDRKHFLTKSTTAPYRPNSTCPGWYRFLDRIMAGNTGLIKYIQRLVGLSLIGKVLEHILVILHGSGSNGKGVLLDTLQAVLGSYAAIAPCSLLTVQRNDQHPTEIAKLFNARIVLASETGQGSRLDEEKVKRLTGGDKRSARRMHEDFWEYTPTDTLWLATNHRPKVIGTDYSIWRRVRLIPFDVQIPTEEQDVGLRDKLLTESPGILSWAVEGCLEYQRIRLADPQEVLMATSSYRAGEDKLGCWISEQCYSGPCVSARTEELWRAYQDWCEGANEHAGRRRAWIDELEKRGYLTEKRTGRPWFGISVTSGIALQAVGSTEP